MTPQIPTQYVVVASITLAAIITQSAGRELRPSEHGLSYQEDSYPPSQNGGDSSGTLTFFGATSVPLPEAKNISVGTWWNVDGDGESRDSQRNHVRMWLLVASAVCGLIGVVLLVVSGIIFLLRVNDKKPEAGAIVSSTSPSTSVPHAAIDKQ